MFEPFSARSFILINDVLAAEPPFDLVRDIRILNVVKQGSLGDRIEEWFLIAMCGARFE